VASTANLSPTYRFAGTSNVLIPVGSDRLAGLLILLMF